jgi:uncharacterized repeat protein (TIGR03803 family)
MNAYCGLPGSGIGVIFRGVLVSNQTKRLLMKINLKGIASGIFLFFAAMLPTSGEVFTNLHTFVNGSTSDGAFPNGLSLNNGVLYGATAQGGSFSAGIAFTLDTNGVVFTPIHHFAGAPTDGSSPNELLVANDTVYGTTYVGGANSVGTVFRMTTNGANYAILRSFTNSPDPQYSFSGLALGGSTLYGTSFAGGSNNQGTVFKLDTNGANFAVLHHFTNNPDGINPRSRLVLNDATLYGTTSGGGSNGMGVIFKINTNGSGYSVIYQFSNSPAAALPYVGLIIASNTLYGVASSGGISNAGAVFSLGTNGANFTIIHSFTNNEGLSPQSSLAWRDGVLYGATLSRGTGLAGTVFRLATNGANFLVLKNFTNALTGANPKGPVLFDANSVYGVANAGGPNSGGTVFRVQLAPVINSQPQGLTVTNGNPAALAIAAASDSPLTYQWFFNTNTALAGQNSNSLNLASAAAANAGTYTVVVSDFIGSVTSSPAILTVLSAPNITAQPQNLTVTNGNPASLAVTATNGTLTYQWYFNTNTLLLNQTNSTFNIASASTNDAGTYTVVVANNIGSTTSSPAILTVSTNSRPIILAQPVSLTVSNGDMANFSTSAIGQGPLRFQWYSNSVNTAIGTLLANRTNSLLTFTNVGTNYNARYFSVIISNTLGKATSSPALLTVISAPVIVSNPQPASVFNGNNATFNVAASGPALNYQWYSNSVNTAIGALLAAQTNLTLLLTNAGTNLNARYFSVIVSNQFGRVASSPALLTVISAPVIVSNPQPASASYGAPTNFLVAAGGAAPLIYQWYFNTNQAQTNLLGNPLAARTNALLDFAAVSNTLAGYYTVIVTNSFGNATSSPALLTVSGGLPVITLQPISVSINLGGSTNFISAASGPGTLGYQWLFNTNTAITGANATNLVITNANWPGYYSMKVTNDFGAATSSPALLTIAAQPTLRSSTFDPASGSYTFSYQYLAGSTNRLWATTNLASAGAWQAIATNIMATNGTWNFTDANTAKTNALRLYRFSTP